MAEREKDDALSTRTWEANEEGRVLVLIAGSDVRTAVLPVSGSITFGRSPECELAWDHPSISRRHARFFGGREIRVEDLESHNGTRVRGVPIAAGTALPIRPGDVIECGAALLVVRARTPEASDNPLVPKARASGLVVGKEGRWFERHPGGRIEFGRRGALRKLLLALAERRVNEPDHGLSSHELFELGWPGEKASVESAQARVYTSVQRLRALGLEGLLLTRDDGYLLDPEIEVRIESS